ncbi:hypothetical protein Taro_033978 [Colocasia esculenta]|uniref:Uncharacterized protein n=1 Tax=Colocasia esculenta TaxID=4460 RepID=A0A843W2U8_COLES|nr:hypothetical protein [Colocasia esculenta]
MGPRCTGGPEARIASLEGIFHSTIQQRDELQRTVTELHAELERAQQMVGDASFSRDEPGRSVLEGQLAATVARGLGRGGHDPASRADEAERLRWKVDELLSQLGTERLTISIIRAKMRGLERSLTLVDRSCSSASRSTGAPSGSVGTT